jgi:Na+-driven multidrug efflux pump
MKAKGLNAFFASLLGMEKEDFEKNAMKESLIIALIGLIIFVALVIYGFKMILDYNGL